MAEHNISNKRALELIERALEIDALDAKECC